MGESDDGWLSVQQVAEYANVSGSMVRGRWVLAWEARGLAKKVLNEPMARQEWRIHPTVLEELQPRPIDVSMAPEAPTVAPSPAPIARCRVTVGNATIEGTRATVNRDGTIVVE